MAVIGGVLEALAAALVKWLAGWLTARQANRAGALRRANRDAALRQSQAMRDSTDRAVEASHVQTDAADDQLRADAAAGGADQLRQQSADIQRAIDAANDRVR